MLRVIGYSYFGDIVAESDKVSILFVKGKQFKRVPYYEQRKMVEYCKSRNEVQMLVYTYCNKYGIDVKEYMNYHEY
jgi:hypothetical protein